MNKGIPFTMSETKTNNSGSSVDSNNKASLQWGEGLLSLARHYLLATSPETINLHSYWIKGTNLELQQLAQQMGLSLQFLPYEKLVSSTWSCPFLIQFNDNSVGIVERVDDSNRIWLRLSGEEKANPILEKLTFHKASKTILLSIESTKQNF